MADWNGIRIFSSVHALNRVCRVVCVRPRARRKRYSVVAKLEPGCYQTSLGLFMHPDLIAKLKAQGGQPGDGDA